MGEQNAVIMRRNEPSRLALIKTLNDPTYQSPRGRLRAIVRVTEPVVVRHGL